MTAPIHKPTRAPRASREPSAELLSESPDQTEWLVTMPGYQGTPKKITYRAVVFTGKDLILLKTADRGRILAPQTAATLLPLVKAAIERARADAPAPQAQRQ